MITENISLKDALRRVNEATLTLSRTQASYDTWYKSEKGKALRAALVEAEAGYSIALRELKEAIEDVEFAGPTAHFAKEK